MVDCAYSNYSFFDIAGRRSAQWNGLLPAVGHTNVCRPLSMMIGQRKTRITTTKRSPRVMVKNRAMTKRARMHCPPDHPGKSICLRLKTFLQLLVVRTAIITQLIQLCSDERSEEEVSTSLHNNAGPDERTRLLPPSGISSNEYYDKSNKESATGYGHRRGSSSSHRNNRSRRNRQSDVNESQRTQLMDNTTAAFLENQVRVD